MRWMAILLAVALAGCTTPADNGDLSNEHTEMGNDQPLTQAMYMRDCQQSVVVFPVDLDTLRAYLPDGFEPLPAEDILAALGVPALPNLSGKGAFQLEGHGCAHADGGDVHIDMNQQVAIQPSTRDEGRREAVPFLLYELGRGGDAHYSNFLEMHGAAPFADEATMTYEVNDGYRSISAEATLDGDVMISFAIAGVQDELGNTFTNAFGRLWTELPNGTLLQEFTPGTGGDPTVYAGGTSVSCTAHPSTVAAQILGATSCEEFIQAGNPIIPTISEIHHMDTTWEFMPHD